MGQGLLIRKLCDIAGVDAATLPKHTARVKAIVLAAHGGWCGFYRPNETADLARGACGIIDIWCLVKDEGAFFDADIIYGGYRRLREGEHFTIMNRDGSKIMDSRESRPGEEFFMISVPLNRDEYDECKRLEAKEE